VRALLLFLCLSSTRAFLCLLFRTNSTIFDCRISFFNTVEFLAIFIQQQKLQIISTNLSNFLSRIALAQGQLRRAQTLDQSTPTNPSRRPP
jgi:hypothetical protein